MTHSLPDYLRPVSEGTEVGWILESQAITQAHKPGPTESRGSQIPGKGTMLYQSLKQQNKALIRNLYQMPVSVKICCESQLQNWSFVCADASSLVTCLPTYAQLSSKFSPINPFQKGFQRIQFSQTTLAFPDTTISTASSPEEPSTRLHII